MSQTMFLIRKIKGRASRTVVLTQKKNKRETAQVKVVKVTKTLRGPIRKH